MPIKLKKIIDEIVTPLDRKMDIHTDGNYLLRRKTTGQYYAGGNIHTPTTTMNKNKASTLTGNEIKNIKYNWPMSWDLIDLNKDADKDNMGGIRVNELSFNADMLNKVHGDVMNFLSSEHKKLGYANPLDTYHLLQQVLGSDKILSKVKGIR